MTWQGGFTNEVATIIAPGAVGTTELAANSVTSAKIAVNLQSDNYDGTDVVTGDATQGWRIERNTARAEFHDLRLRGTILGNLTMTTSGEIRTASGTSYVSMAGDASNFHSLRWLSSSSIRGQLFYSGGTFNLEGTGSNLFLSTFGGGNITIKPWTQAFPAAGGTITIEANNSIRIGGTRLELAGGTSPTASVQDIYWGYGNNDFIRHDDSAGVKNWYIYTDGSPDLTLNATWARFAGDLQVIAPTTTTTGNTATWINFSGGIYEIRFNTSSARYKTAIRPWDNRASVLNLTPSLYKSRAGTDDKRKVHLGLIAEEVASIFPIAALYDENQEPNGIDWPSLTTGLLVEVKNLKERVELLEKAA